jgi:hypothetical protein
MSQRSPSMPIPTSPLLLAAAVLGAGALAWFVADGSQAENPQAPPPPAATLVSDDPEDLDEDAPSPLPPGHPPVESSGVSALDDDDTSPAVTWTRPKEWTDVPNASPMRLATYRAAEDVEISVVRAGGTVDANVQRWTGQFEAAAKVDRRHRTVHGLEVTLVRIAGTFAGASEMAPAAGPSRPGWVMLAAIVEGEGLPYFFKLVGPAPGVERASPSFERLVEGVAPVPTPK